MIRLVFPVLTLTCSSRVTKTEAENAPGMPPSSKLRVRKDVRIGVVGQVMGNLVFGV